MLDGAPRFPGMWRSCARFWKLQGRSPAASNRHHSPSEPLFESALARGAPVTPVRVSFTHGRFSAYLILRTNWSEHLTVLAFHGLQHDPSIAYRRREPRKSLRGNGRLIEIIPR